MDAEQDNNDRVGLRVTAFSAMGEFSDEINFCRKNHSKQCNLWPINVLGARKYQEDMFSVAYQKSDNSNGLDYAYFGIFDG